MAWIVGPKEFISAIGSCGSYLDGGTNVPFQEAAIPMLEPTKVRNEMKALQRHFKDKRDYVLGRLESLGFRIKHVPDSTFYIWLDLSSLPKEINDGLSFFQKCLEENVIGGFFILIAGDRSLVGADANLELLTYSRARHLLRPEPGQEEGPFRQPLPPLHPLVLRTSDGGVEDGS